METVDDTVVRQLSLTACGTLPPLATTVGGVVAQEALIALTGKFSPLQQWVSACCALHVDLIHLKNVFQLCKKILFFTYAWAN